ncbi:putative ribonuclease H protein [Senna tora]|uniref:Putative ribonuclease H protein n=1 Tax=Senna tora TaxID=362788 RepID=A0A834XFK8_9FABA|nr:putative ribonuclease H protein [Senna tora]
MKVSQKIQLQEGREILENEIIFMLQKGELSKKISTLVSFSEVPWPTKPEKPLTQLPVWSRIKPPIAKGPGLLEQAPSLLSFHHPTLGGTHLTITLRVCSVRGAKAVAVIWKNSTAEAIPFLAVKTGEGERFLKIASFLASQICHKDRKEERDDDVVPAEVGEVESNARNGVVEGGREGEGGEIEHDAPWAAVSQNRFASGRDWIWGWRRRGGNWDCAIGGGGH